MWLLKLPTEKNIPDRIQHKILQRDNYPVITCLPSLHVSQDFEADQNPQGKCLQFWKSSFPLFVCDVVS